VAIAITNALTARNKSGMTDAIIDQVRQLLADGVMNKTIETQLNLSRGVITNIKCGAMVKLSEMDTDTFKDKYAMDSEASPKTPTPEHKQPGRRKISNPKLMDMLKYLVNHPMSVLELTDKSQELFEITFTAAVAKNVLRGKTRLDEVEFPVGDTTWTEYLDMLNIIMDRDYTNLAWEYKRSLKA
jgi:methyltransferase-like protein